VTGEAGGGGQQQSVPLDPPVHGVVVDLDADALDTAVGRWIIGSVAATSSVSSRKTAYSVDGKTLPGSGPAGAQKHLLAVLDQHTGTVIGQVDVDGNTNEITRFRPLLDHLDQTGALVTADALHTQREHARWLVDTTSSAYLFTEKNNQPSLYRQLKKSAGPATDLLLVVPAAYGALTDVGRTGRGAAHAGSRPRSGG
jgi:hypothetical protein